MRDRNPLAVTGFKASHLPWSYILHFNHNRFSWGSRPGSIEKRAIELPEPPSWKGRKKKGPWGGSPLLADVLAHCVVCFSIAMIMTVIVIMGLSLAQMPQ